MNLRASRNRILPVVIVLIALAANGTPRRQPFSDTQVPLKSAADRVPVTPRPEAAPSDLAASASPAPPTRAAKSVEPARPSNQASAAAGMVIAVDPETGTLGPPSESQWAELRSAVALARLRREAAVEMRRPDGAVGIDVGGWLQEFAVVRTGPDGKPIFGCLRPGEVSPDSAVTPLEIQ